MALAHTVSLSTVPVGLTTVRNRGNRTRGLQVRYQSQGGTAGRTPAEQYPLGYQSSRRLQLLRSAAVPLDTWLEAGASQSNSPIPSLSGSELSRRHLNLLVSTAALLCISGSGRRAEAADDTTLEDAAATTGTATSLTGGTLVEDAEKGYRVVVPPGWEQKEKAGANMLYADPNRGSNTLGVVVLPVRVGSLEQFGSIDTVGERLIKTEQAKQSTYPGGAKLVGQAVSRGASGAAFYDFDYTVFSTRGTKHTLSRVTIANNSLYIVNLNFKEPLDPERPGLEEALHQSIESFDLLE